LLVDDEGAGRPEEVDQDPKGGGEATEEEDDVDTTMTLKDLKKRMYEIIPSEILPPPAKRRKRYV
jgi:hypothetical protein